MNLPKLDYEILPTYDVRVMRVADISDWEHLISEPSYIDIKTPARKNSVTLYFQKEKINTFNSNNLELSTNTLSPLPDGLYTIKIYICEGDRFCKEGYYLRTVRTFIELDEALISLHTDCCGVDEKKLKEYLKIEILLKSAHANVRRGNINQAMCEYDQAKELLEKFKL